MSLDTLKKLLVYLAITFVVVSVWRDPAGSADVAGKFLGSVGSFFSTVVAKGGKFLKGLSN